jgi:AraC-like DNA-binding protein
MNAQTGRRFRLPAKTTMHDTKQVLLQLDGACSPEELAAGLACGRYRLQKIADGAGLEGHRVNEVWSATRVSPALPRVLEAATRLIESRLQKPISIDEIAKTVGTARRTLYRLFINNLETPPGRYISESRTRLTLRLLAETDQRVGEIFDRAGFQDYPHAFRRFRDTFGMTPLTYREVYRNPGLQVRDRPAALSLLRELIKSAGATGSLVFTVVKEGFLIVLGDGLPFDFGMYARALLRRSPNMEQCLATGAAHQGELDLQQMDLQLINLINMCSSRAAAWLPLPAFRPRPAVRNIVLLVNPRPDLAKSELEDLNVRAHALIPLLPPSKLVAQVKRRSGLFQFRSRSHQGPDRASA